MTKVALNSLSFLNTLEQIARDIWTSDDLELWGGGGLHLEDNVEKYANIAGGDQYRDFYEFWMLGLKK